MPKIVVEDFHFQPNEKPQYFFFPRPDGDEDHITVEMENSMRGLFWRMTVNGKEGPVGRYYEGIYSFMGYCLTTAYWGDDGVTFREFIPYKPVFAQKRC